MIYTVTLNPSLDYIVSVKEFKSGFTNRTTNELINPGGKGINVSIVLSNLGIKSIALGFYAGFTGGKIINLLDKAKIDNKLIKLSDGYSRINVKCRNVDADGNVNDETEINGIGPKINNEAIDLLYSQIDTLQENDILVLSGSVPSNLPHTIYKDITHRLKNKNIKIVVDATKDLLVNTLENNPFLIKPNKHELEEIFDVDISNDDEIEKYAKKLHDMGSVNVLVSIGADGALLVDESGIVHKVIAPKGEVKNSVGAGDSMVAGFIYGYIETNDYEKALNFAVATGSASAFSETFALKNDVINLYNQL